MAKIDKLVTEKNIFKINQNISTVFFCIFNHSSSKVQMEGLKLFTVIASTRI